MGAARDGLYAISDEFIFGLSSISEEMCWGMFLLGISAGFFAACVMSFRYIVYVLGLMRRTMFFCPILVITVNFTNESNAILYYYMYTDA